MRFAGADFYRQISHAVIDIGRLRRVLLYTDGDQINNAAPALLAINAACPHLVSSDAIDARPSPFWRDRAATADLVVVIAAHVS